MKSKLRVAIICLSLIVGIGCLVYPLICNLIQKNHNSSIIEEYENEVNTMDINSKNELIDSVKKYNENLVTNKVQDVDYNSVLSISGFMGYIDIPKSDIYLPIYSSTSDFVLENGIGHLEGSSLPYGGDSSHCVLTGHTGMAENRLFTDIDKLEINDMFYIHILGEVHAYQVNDIQVLLPEDIDSFDIIGGKDYITLMTCTPYGINTHRLLVRGIRVPYEENVVEENKDVSSSQGNSFNEQNPTNIFDYSDNCNTQYYKFFGIAAIFIVVLVLIIIFVFKKHRRVTHES